MSSKRDPLALSRVAFYLSGPRMWCGAAIQLPTGSQAWQCERERAHHGPHRHGVVSTFVIRWDDDSPHQVTNADNESELLL